MASPRTPQLVEDADALSGLEQRVLRAVDLVQQLRTERDTALRQADQARTENEELRGEIQRLTEEVDGLRSERTEVRSRIERLLSQMEELAG